MVLIKSNKEALLLSRLKNGEEAAFDELYNIYSPRIYNFVCSTLFNKSLAEDITQSCFIKVWERKEELDLSLNFSSYLYTIAKNLVYRESERQILDARYINFIKNLDIENHSTVEDTIQLEFIQKRIHNLIEELPEARKKIFILSRMKGHSNKEIATILSISERTVETQIYRTLIYLKEKLQHYLLFLTITYLLYAFV